MKNKNHISSNNSENFDFLDAITKKEDFQIPKDYFSNLERDILRKVDEETKIIHRPNRFKKWTWAAAIAVSIVIGIYFVNNNKATDCKSFACLFENSDLSDSELESLEENSGMELFEDEDDGLF